ncbi:hypothetical protein [Photobacterium sanctipauli]|uniref:hypothetical protein n=1 Tax=Photobacterium sanctipauli TaxID=1342794 RepID=UPI00056607ED|nr:hypothetical protein [Photobacterium sanctipauli]
MKKYFALAATLLALFGCDSDEIEPVVSEHYCASVKFSATEYKIDRIKTDYQREALALDDSYCEKYNKYVFNTIESEQGESTLYYTAPYLISDFDDSFYSFGFAKNGEGEGDIATAIISSDFNSDNLDARLKLLLNQAYIFPPRVRYNYYNISVLDVIEACLTEEANCQDIDLDNLNPNLILNNIRAILSMLELTGVFKPNESFLSIDEAVEYDSQLSKSLGADEMFNLYETIKL